MALASSESSTIPPVIITFVRASPNSITLDFSLGAAPKLRSGAQPTPLQVACYELLWRLVAEPGARIGPSQDSPWEVASSTLKNSRCTKGGLAAGAAYAFRARCCNTGQFWGALGPETAPLRTLLPELPADCSESLKVPSKVLAAQAEKEAERAQREATERTARDSAAHAERVQHEHARQPQPDLREHVEQEERGPSGQPRGRGAHGAREHRVRAPGVVQRDGGECAKDQHRPAHGGVHSDQGGRLGEGAVAVVVEQQLGRWKNKSVCCESGAGGGRIRQAKPCRRLCPRANQRLRNRLLPAGGVRNKHHQSRAS
jgi:hypothetical protein